MAYHKGGRVLIAAKKRRGLTERIGKLSDKHLCTMYKNHRRSALCTFLRGSAKEIAGFEKRQAIYESEFKRRGISRPVTELD